MHIRFSLLIIGLMALLFWGCNSSRSKDASSIGIFNIMNYGASKDTTVNSATAIQQAIDACHAQGGGRVVVPQGNYMTGTLLMRDHVELHLMQGATLFGSVDSVDYNYEIEVEGTFKKDGKTKMMLIGLIIGDKANDFSITGKGVIDGRGGIGRAFQCYPLSDGVDAPWHKPRRPYILMFYGCEHVKVHDITTKNSNAWTQRYKRCKFLEIRGVTLDAHANANSDGIDIDECQDVIVSNCNLDTDDNAIILKSLGVQDCENITITNCVFASKITAIKTGTESGGGFKNITISNCIIRSSYETHHFDKNRQQMNGSGIALETTDGGTMDGVIISNIVMQDCYAPFFFRLGNRGRMYGGKTPESGTMRNIIIDNVICKNVRNNYTSTIAGFPDHYIENLTMSNIRMECNGGIMDEEFNPMPEVEKLGFKS